MLESLLIAALARAPAQPGTEPAVTPSAATRWLVGHLPPALLRPGLRGVLWWQWLILPFLAAAAWALALIAARLSTALLTRLAARTPYRWDDELVGRLRGPLRVGWAIAIVSIGLPWLELSTPAQRYIDGVLATGFFVVVFWALLRAADLLGHVAAQSPWAAAHPASRSLLPLAVRVGKVAILGIAVVGVLSLWGYPVASLLAGLGIGGLAFALAAQKTVENLFGSFSIGVDQPFREGDFIRVDDCLGTVEAIGLRSTRIRTPDRTIVTMPNGKLADARVESFAVRDRLRLSCVLALVYGTTEPQMRRVLAGVEELLRRHPKVWPEITVRFKELGASSLNIDVGAWFKTSDWDEFQVIRQEMLLGFMAVVDSAGTSFALPTQTLHVDVARRAAATPGPSPATDHPTEPAAPPR